MKNTSNTSNRLRLDFSLQEANARANYVQSYLEDPSRFGTPLSQSELETIANYVLWGKDSDGKAPTEKGELQIETRNKTWDSPEVESLDALLESPTFNEATLRRPSEARPRVTRSVFSRKEALAQCPPHLVPVFEDLFARIDALELRIHFYEFAHGRRKEPPRQELQSRFTESELAKAQAEVTSWNQFFYLKQRHLIVELRREQYTLRDTFVNAIMRHTAPEPDFDHTDPDFDAEIPVYPLGLANTPIGSLLFRSQSLLNPSSYTQEEIDAISHFYWEKQNDPISNHHTFFDFQNLEHVYELIGQLSDMEETLPSLPVESTLAQMVSTLRYYVESADLSEAQKEILHLKINKMRNQDIARYVNKKYGKTYTSNYISTIFRQKIIPRIVEAVTLHLRTIENLYFPENFKRCAGCGLTLLVDADLFVRKTRSKDGYATRCKKCDRLDRQKRK